MGVSGLVTWEPMEILPNLWCPYCAVYNSIGAITEDTCLKVKCPLQWQSMASSASETSAWGFPGGSVVKNPSANAGNAASITGSERSPGKGKWQPTPVFLPGKSHGQRSLSGYSPWSLKESEMTEQLTLWMYNHCLDFFFFSLFGLLKKVSVFWIRIFYIARLQRNNLFGTVLHTLRALLPVLQILSFSFF